MGARAATRHPGNKRQVLLLACLRACPHGGLEPWVADRFRASRMGDDNTALAARLMGLDMHEDPFLETGWDDFVRWLMLTYVTADKIEAMELRVTAMTCSSVKLVDQFIIDFNTAAMSSEP